MDLTTCDEHGVPWDFSKADRRKAAMDYIKRARPIVVIGSPMCRMFSQIMRIDVKRQGRERYQREFRAAVDHVLFMLEVYDLQAKSGRYFVHEHPQQASSWNLPQVQQFILQNQVYLTTNHLCMFGLTSTDRWGRSGPSKKPTTWMTNSPEIAKELGGKCDGSHVHVQLDGGDRTVKSQVYPHRFCDAILKGLGAPDQIGFRGQQCIVV